MRRRSGSRERGSGSRRVEVVGSEELIDVSPHYHWPVDHCSHRMDEGQSGKPRVGHAHSSASTAVAPISVTE